ncbi:MAG TPA: lipid-A-disaccharide synthase [Woeseiaceae bacterium]|nr:lipid-A-disaccharide synthase [Woeseiaceae bacterium]
MKFALVAGEASGDLLAAGLIRALRERVPDAEFEGVAGPRMRDAGCAVLADADLLAVMGLVEPLVRLPMLLRLRARLKAHWRARPPDVFVGVDAPDFNLGLETALKSAGIRTAHYVSPSVWAWRQGRVGTIRAAADRVLCILPFEKAFYDRHGIDAVFVGHPMADRAPEFVDTAAARRELGLGTGPEEGQVLAVLPGSRMSEVSRLAPVFAGAARLLSARYPRLRFALPVASPRLDAAIRAALDAAGVSDRFHLFDGRSETVLAAADVALLASGTAALEAALLQKPMVAAYRVAPLTAMLIRRLGLLKVPTVTLPNQLTETPLVPELLQEQATPEAAADAVAGLLDDPSRRAAIAGRFAKLRSELALGADERAADAVLSLAT